MIWIDPLRTESGSVVSMERSSAIDTRRITINSSAVGVVIGALGEHFMVVRPYSISISDSDQDGVFVASDAISSVFGVGRSPAMAYEDYKQSLIETIEFLGENESELGAALSSELERLRFHIRHI